MDEQLKQRLVGATVLVSLAVIVVPMILDTPSGPEPEVVAPRIPPKPEAGDFSSSIVPLEEPRTPMLDEDVPGVGSEPAPGPVRDDPGSEPEPTPPTDVAAVPAPEAESAPVSTTPASAPAPEETTGTEASAEAQARGSAPGPTGWAVQLGSFSNSQNAINLRDRLRANGYEAFVETVQSEPGEVTRVFVGPALGRDRAQETVDRLFAETKLKGIVVRYPGS